MSLSAQADLVDGLVSHWREPASDDRMICSPVWLNPQDIEDLRTISKTLRVLGIHGADEYVRAKVAKERKTRGQL